MYMSISLSLYISLCNYISKFGGCKRQDSSAKRTPRINGKCSRRAREEVRKSYSPRAVCTLHGPCTDVRGRGRGRGRPRSMGMHTSLCAVFAKIAFSPTRNTKSNTKNRPLSNDMFFFMFLKNVCSRLRETLL